MLYINNENIEKVYSMKQCMEDVEDCLHYYQRNQTHTPLRTSLQHNTYSGMTLYMPSYIEMMEYVAVKVVTIFPENDKVNLPSLQGVILLTETKHGRHLATIEASGLTVKRTGALTGIATKYLANREATNLSILGCGAQARGQFEAVINVRPIKRVFLWNRTKQKALDFKEEINKKFPFWGGEIIVCDEANEAVSEADVLVLSTKSDQSLFDAKELRRGVHINAIGSYRPDLMEFGVDALNVTNQVWVDTFEGVMHEAGDLIQPVNEGKWSWDKVNGELSELIIDPIKKGRQSKDDITLFKSVGVAYVDTYVAAKVYELLHSHVNNMNK